MTHRSAALLQMYRHQVADHSSDRAKYEKKRGFAARGNDGIELVEPGRHHFFGEPLPPGPWIEPEQ